MQSRRMMPTFEIPCQSSANCQNAFQSAHGPKICTALFLAPLDIKAFNYDANVNNYGRNISNTVNEI